MGNGIPTLGIQAAISGVDATAPNRIVITFPDDHDINGMKVEVMAVTSEQIAVAVYHLTRAANQLADLRQMAAMKDAATVADAMAGLAQERNGRG